MLFVIVMMTINHILTNCIYKLHKSKEKINHLMYMDDIKLFSKKEKELEILMQAVTIYREDTEMKFGIENVQ